MFLADARPLKRAKAKLGGMMEGWASEADREGWEDRWSPAEAQNGYQRASIARSLEDPLAC